MLRLPDKLPKKKRRELRVRSQGHLQFIRRHHCVVPGCERLPVEAAHVGSIKGHSLKCDDSETVPLCGGMDGHHAEQHRIGIRSFEAKHKIVLADYAAEFWKQSPARGAWEKKANAA